MNSHSKPIKSNLKTNSISKSNVPKIRKGRSLRLRLLGSVLPAVLIPLAITSAIGYRITQNRINNDVSTQLEKNAVLASSAVSAFIRDSFKIPELLTSNEQIIQAMREGTQELQNQGLSQQSIETLEKKFATTKLLKANATLNNQLKDVVKSSDIIEIFYTERNGLNVAFSNPTSDFVQRDEGWWQSSKSEGQAIDEPEFDQSARATVFALSKAVKDPQT